MKAGIKPRYDGHCRDDAEPVHGVKPVVRFRNSLAGEVVFDDLVRGPISISNTELDDLVIARPDGSPTYNFTVVVDDIDMEVSIVIRGDDHINNTPRQINIYRALDAEPPQFAHVPMILGDDGARLSKRHGAVVAGHRPVSQQPVCDAEHGGAIQVLQPLNKGGQRHRGFQWRLVVVSADRVDDGIP